MITYLPPTHKLSHSLLLSGGALQDALDLAKQILGPNHHRKIDSGNHPDIHLYTPEGKSYLHPMASIQKLIQELAFPPFEAPFKIFIIEEAEKMLPSSSNALLKSLEEPHEDTFFFLLSNQSDLLLPTILSRLYPLNFSRKDSPAIDLSRYHSLAFNHQWDELLDALSELENEDPKAILHGFLRLEKDPFRFKKLSELVLDAQKALDHHIKARSVYLHLFLELVNE